MRNNLMERRGTKGGGTALFYPQQQQTTNKNSRHFLFNPYKCDQESSAFKRTAMAIKKKDLQNGGGVGDHRTNERKASSRPVVNNNNNTQTIARRLRERKSNNWTVPAGWPLPFWPLLSLHQTPKWYAKGGGIVDALHPRRPLSPAQLPTPPPISRSFVTLIAEWWS